MSHLRRTRLASSRKKIKKKPRQGPAAKVSKQPAISPLTDTDQSARPRWNLLSRLDQGYPPGHHPIPSEKLTNIRNFLENIGTQTWGEILKRDSGNHYVVLDDDTICAAARRRLKEIEICPDALISLRMTGRKRIWGIREGAVLHLLWWDPDHEVWPTGKKHT